MKYRKRPVTIEAMQFTEESIDDLNDWLAEGGASFMFLQSPDRTSLAIDTLEGTMMAHPGDWIIRGVQGEHYPCKSAIFAETYEPIT